MVPDLHGIDDGSNLSVELMEEKLLRGLTREICSLLAVLASPGLNAGLPSLEHAGQISRGDVSSLKGLDTFTSSSVVGYGNCIFFLGGVFFFSLLCTV